MGVIAVGLAGVAATLYFGHQKSQHGDRVAEATNLARTIIELSVGRSFLDNNTNVPLQPNGLPTNASGLNDPPTATPRPLLDPPFNASDFLPISEAGVDRWAYLRDYQRRIIVTRVGAAGTPEELLLRMNVTLFWEEKGGRHNVSLSAIVPTSRPITP